MASKNVFTKWLSKKYKPSFNLCLQNRIKMGSLRKSSAPKNRPNVRLQGRSNGRHVASSPEILAFQVHAVQVTKAVPKARSEGRIDG